MESRSHGFMRIKPGEWRSFNTEMHVAEDAAAPSKGANVMRINSAESSGMRHWQRTRSASRPGRRDILRIKQPQRDHATDAHSEHAATRDFMVNRVMTEGFPARVQPLHIGNDQMQRALTELHRGRMLRLHGNQPSHQINHLFNTNAPATILSHDPHLPYRA
jgi:hypothetical protein